jgi:hypothetical protein
MSAPAEWGDPEPFGEGEDGEPLFWECPNPECSTQKTSPEKAAAHCAGEDGDSGDTDENEPTTDASSPSEPRATTVETGSQDGSDPPDDERARAALASAISYFREQVDREIDDHTEAGDHPDRPTTAREYFREAREWSDATIDANRVGWAPPDNGEAFALLREEGFDPETVRATGLFNRRDELLWQGRYVLPYFDADGHPVYAIARCTGDKGGGAAGYDGHPADYMAGKYAKIAHTRENVPFSEPMWGRHTLRDGADVVIAEGIADAITAHAAGHAVLSPVAKEFKRDHFDPLLDALDEFDVGRVYVIPDNERAGFGRVEDAPNEPESIREALNIPKTAPGPSAGLRTAAFLAESGVDARLVDLPLPAESEDYHKVDLDDYLHEWDEDLRAVMRGARRPSPATFPKRYERAVGTPIDDENDDGQPQPEATRGASGPTTSPRSGPSSGGEHENASAVFDLDVIDLTGPAFSSIGDRGKNPLGHTGDSENYAVVRKGENGDPVLTDYKRPEKPVFNGLTYLLVDAGERTVNNPEGELSDAELFAAWRHAKDEGYIPDDDPIPLRALFHVLVDEDECDADDWVWRTVEEGKKVGTSDDDPRAFDEDVRFGLPPGGFNTGLDLVEDRGVEHGREHIDTGGREDEDVDPRSIDVTFEPGVAWRAAQAVTPANLDRAREGDDDLRALGLDPSDDGEAWRCPHCAGSINVVRAVAVDEGLAEGCEQPLADRRYDEAYRRARRQYGAPLPEYVSEETATERWDVIQGALQQLDHYHLDAVRSDVTSLGDEADASALCEIDPCWTDSASGQRVVAFRSGVFYCREHERVLDPVRFVALEEGILDACDDELAGTDFREAYAATRDRGAPLPRWNVGDPDHRPVLPPADELVGDEFSVNQTGLDGARNEVENLYGDLATDATGAHLLGALTTLGKTTATVKTAREQPTLYAGPRKELQKEVEEKADEYGVSWMHLPVLAEAEPDEVAVGLAVDAVREDGKGLLRDREALLNAAGLDADEDGYQEDDETDEDSGAGERFETPGDAREAGFDSLTAARAAVERANAAAGDATGGEDGEEVDLDRASCPTANGDHGPAWQLAVHVARELGSTPKEIHVDAERLFGEEIPCQHGDHEEDESDCPYSLAWSRATDPEDPFDLLIGNYGHAHVAGARTYYHTNERDRTRLDPRTVAIDEFPGEAYASSFGDEALDHARWLAATLDADVEDRESLVERERELWDDDWVRAWLHSDANDHPVGERALAHLDAADACRRVAVALDATRSDIEDEDTTVVAGGGDEHEKGVAAVRDVLDRLDTLAPEWDPDALAECYDTLSELDLRPRTALTTDGDGLRTVLVDAIRALIESGAGNADDGRDALARGDRVLDDLVTEAVAAGRRADANAQPLLDAARTAVRGGEDGCRELAARADDPYAHPDAHLLLYGAIAQEDEQDGESGETDSVAESIDTAAFGFDHRRDGGRLKRSQLGRATILWDRDHHGAYVHDPPEFEDRAGAKNPVVGLDATGREELWGLALGQDVKREDIHDTPAERRAFLRDVLNVQVVQTTPHQKFYEGSTASKNFDPDVALVRRVASEFGNQRIRSDRITSTGPPGVITTKCVREAIEGRLDGHASVVDNYGNVTGSNALAGCRLGCVLGTQHYGDHTVEKWAALAGESVGRTGRGTDLDYDSDVANEYLGHMSADQTMQAILRFGRDEGGAVVFAHTAALRDELPVVADGAVATTYSGTAREVRDAALDHIGRDESFTAADIERTDNVDCSRRSIQRALREFADLGYIERHDPGAGRANEYQPVADPGVGDVELPSVDGPATTAESGPGSIAADRDSDHSRVHYTWSVGVRPSDGEVSRPEPAATATLPAPAVADGGDRPPDPAD